MYKFIDISAFTTVPKLNFPPDTVSLPVSQSHDIFVRSLIPADVCTSHQDPLTQTLLANPKAARATNVGMLRHPNQKGHRASLQ